MKVTDVPGYLPTVSTERLAAEVDAAWAERAAQVDATARLDDVLMVSSFATSVALPSLPRGLDSKTHRAEPLSTAPGALETEKPKSLAQIALEVDAYLAEDGVEPRWRGERVQRAVLQEGRQRPYLAGWQTRPTAEETERALAAMERRKKAGFYYSNDY